MRFNELSSTKQKIILASEKLFREHGYHNTSMRMLADACEMAVGNLCYHYPKKEDILMEDHNILMDAFRGQIAELEKQEDPWVTYVAAEFCFLLRISQDREILDLYRQVINIPTLRQDYYMKHHELLEMYFSAKDFGLTEHQFYMSTVAFSALCFQGLEQYDEHHPEELREDLIKTFETRLLFLGLDPFEKDEAIRSGMELGRREFEKISNKELFYGA